MTSEEVVLKILEKANKNNSNDNQPIDKPRAIIAVNEAQNKFVEWVLEKKNEDDIRLIQLLLVPEEKLSEYKKTEDSQYFNLPTNLFEFTNIKAIAQEDKCKDVINLWEAKAQNVNELLADENNSPSFYYRESFYYLSNGKIRIFRKNFNITSASISYYRYPRIINVDGYIGVDGNTSYNVDPEWDDKVMDRIISIAVKDLNINAENLNRVQVDNQRIVNEF